ncbi:hypothetical protein KO481_16920 [Nocardia sp. NEAU-G5]|uniref:Uncharacterized protein n=1 Tax=Nocardia albiluteola TaxID=2842303 RepID=A0ABS6AYX3_9NOCA|nr:hypothetical protein [Nocardia albiluteola]MBU3063204.1 hypothetical protein [Nocardia albiluteola]
MAGSEHIPGVEPHHIVRRGNHRATVYTGWPEGEPRRLYWPESADGTLLGHPTPVAAKAILIARRYLRSVTTTPASR